MSFILEIEENKIIVFLDTNTGEVYENGPDLNLVPAREDIKNYVVENIVKKQIEFSPSIPEEELNNAMNTEKDLSDKNAKHIFRRN